jgi:hypothetical protein
LEPLRAVLGAGLDTRGRPDNSRCRCFGGNATELDFGSPSQLNAGLWRANLFSDRGASEEKDQQLRFERQHLIKRDFTIIEVPVDELPGSRIERGAARARKGRRMQSRAGQGARRGEGFAGAAHPTK